MDRRIALAEATALVATGSDRPRGWIGDAQDAYDFLRKRTSLTPAAIRVGPALIADQSDPTVTRPAPGRGPGMPTVITDTQIATYPAAEDVDSKGFDVPGTITLTDDDTAGAIVTRTDNSDGTTSFSAVAPGTVNLTWTDGTLTFTDTLEVDPGAPASIQVGAPVITDQTPAGP
jgi:hypothetical protein